MDYIPNKGLSHLLVTQIVVACLIIWGFGCARTPMEGSMRFEHPRITIMGIPEGFRIRSDADDAGRLADMNKILHSNQFKSLFSYYVDDSGKNFEVEGLGLEVVDYKGTLEPVKFDNFKVILLRTLTAKGHFEFRPVLTISSEATSGEYVELTLKGHFLKITPKYTLTVDPLNPIVPRGFVQDLFYADKISAENVSISKLSGEAQARRGDIGGEVDLQYKAVEEFVQKYEYAIFGKFQVVERDDLAAVLPEQTVSIILSPKEKGYFRYGGREQPVEIVPVGTADQISVKFLGEEHALVPGRWILFNDGQGVLYYKELDSTVSPRRVVLQYIEFSEDYRRTFGKHIRFKPHPSIGTQAVQLFKPLLLRAPDPLKDKFVGRTKELEDLDNAWKASRASVVGIIGWGGFGKSALAREWIYKNKFDQMNSEAQAVFWKKFDSAKDLDEFLYDFATYLRNNRSPPADSFSSKQQKLQTIADAITGKRFLLVLDGLEVLQNQTPGAQLGFAVDPLGDLLKIIAKGEWGRGLCIVTSRLSLRDLAEYEGNGYLEMDLEKRRLSIEESVLLLEREGVVRGPHEQKTALAEHLGRHPLAMKMAAHLLKIFKNGEAGRWSEFPNPLGRTKSDTTSKEGRHDVSEMDLVFSWYDTQLDTSDTQLLSILSHFQEPPKLDWIFYVYNQLSADVVLDIDGLYKDIAHLKSLKLIHEISEVETYEINPLVASHYRNKLGNTFSKNVHGRLYEAYRDGNFYASLANPRGIKDLLPLFRSVSHGAKAGRYHEALNDVYFDKISKRELREHINKYGVLSTSLATLAPFFQRLPAPSSQPQWDVPVAELNPNDSVFVLNEVATLLHMQGKLADAVKAYNTSLSINKSQQNKEGTVKTLLTLSQLYLLLGDIPKSLEDSNEADKYSTGNKSFEIASLSALANAKVQKGLLDEAEELFKKAFEIKKGVQGPTQFEDSVQDYLYITLLLEQGKVTEAVKHFVYMSRDDISELPPAKKDLSDMPLTKRALYFQLRGNLTMALMEIEKRNLLDRARNDFDHAIELMQGPEVGIETYLPGALLSRAEYYLKIRSYDKAKRDLQDAMSISKKSRMRLHEVDCHILLARLYKAQGDLNTAKREVTDAIHQSDALGYLRRKTVIDELMSSL